MYTTLVTIAFLSAGAWSAPAKCPPKYHLAFSTNRNTSEPIYHSAQLIQPSGTSETLIVAGDLLDTSKPITTGALAIFSGTGSKQCLSLSSNTIKDAGLSIGTPRLDPSGPAYSYPIIASPGYQGDCRWNLGTDPNKVSVFPGIYEGNEGLYSCKTTVNGVVYDVLSLGKTGGDLSSPKDCLYTVATAFKGT